MSEPTVQLWEGGAKHKVTDLPGWHEHPECPDDEGRPLRHMHGLSAQPPHTHEPKRSWGPSVPVPNNGSETSEGAVTRSEVSTNLDGNDPSGSAS